MSDTVWVVGQWREDGKPWEMIGVFTDKSRAIDACVEDSFFTGPQVLGEAAGADPVPWVGCYYPRLQDKPA